MRPNVGVMRAAERVGGAIVSLALAVMLTAGRVPCSFNYTLPDNDMLERRTGSSSARRALEQVVTSRRFLEKHRAASPRRSPTSSTICLEDLKRRDRDVPTSSSRSLGLSLLPSFECSVGSSRPNALTKSQVSHDPLLERQHGRAQGHPALARRTSCPTSTSVARSARDRGRAIAILGVLPFFHSFGYTVTLCGDAPCSAGRRSVYHANVRPTPRLIGKLCVRAPDVTILTSTPTFYQGSTCGASRQGAARPRARRCSSGAEKLQAPRWHEAWEEKLRRAASWKATGATELSPVVAFNVPNARGHGGSTSRSASKPGHDRPAATVGVAVRIVDADTGARSASPARRGSCSRSSGPNVMLGYLERNPTLTAAVIRGTVGTSPGTSRLMDKRRLPRRSPTACRRFSKIGGEMVPHGRVEDALNDALSKLEGVETATLQEQGVSLAVTSLPDEKKGERLVVVHTEISVTAEDLVRELHEAGLPKLYAPRSKDFVQVADLPYLGTGKLDLRQLREVARQGSAASRT